MKRITLYVKFIFTGIIFLLLASCKKENMCDCLKGTGGEETEIRNISGFAKIKLYNNVDLVIRHGKPYGCKVIAGSHLIDKITTETDGEFLVIRNNNKCNWVRSFQNKYTVEVSLPSLQYIYYAGSGNISSADTIHETIFSMDGWTCSGSVNLLLNTGTSWLTLHTGTADLKVSGNSGVSYVYNSGSGPMDCSKLETGYTYVTNAGTNDLSVWVTKELGARIMLQGDIYYLGSPYKIEKDIAGKGSLIHR